jgi:hypothetical protein
MAQNKANIYLSHSSCYPPLSLLKNASDFLFTSMRLADDPNVWKSHRHTIPPGALPKVALTPSEKEASMNAMGKETEANMWHNEKRKPTFRVLTLPEKWCLVRQVYIADVPFYKQQDL